MTLIIPVVLAFLGQEIEFQQGPPIIRRAIGLIDNVDPRYQIGLMMAVILLLIVLKNLASVSNQLASAHLSRLLVRDLRLNAIKLLLDIDIDYYSKTKLGDVLNYVNQEVGRCSSAIKIGIRTLTNAMTVLIFVGILILISWQLTIVSTLLLMIVPFLSQFVIRRSQEYGRLLSEKSRAYSGALIEILNGIRLVKSTGQEKPEYEKIQRLIEEREQAEMQSQVNYSIIGPMNEMSGLMVILAIIVAGRLIFSNQLETLSTLLLTYLFVLSRVVPMIGQLNNSRSEFANVIPSTIIVSEFLRLDDKPLMKDGTEPYQKLQEGIHFDNLSFSYPGHKDMVL
ncbi:MAG: ABC transporter transmembrane domain-containing protein, partial [Chroococcales cyanobacterium]